MAKSTKKIWKNKSEIINNENLKDRVTTLRYKNQIVYHPSDIAEASND